MSFASAIVSASLFVVGAIFGAGGAWVTLKRVRKDLNGMGAKLARLDHEAWDAYLTLSVGMMAICPEEKREHLAAILNDKSRGK